jgi:hypothetical protein
VITDKNFFVLGSILEKPQNSCPLPPIHTQRHTHANKRERFFVGSGATAFQPREVPAFPKAQGEGLRWPVHRHTSCAQQAEKRGYCLWTKRRRYCPWTQKEGVLPPKPASMLNPPAGCIASRLTSVPQQARRRVCKRRRYCLQDPLPCSTNQQGELQVCSPLFLNRQEGGPVQDKPPCF